MKILHTSDWHIGKRLGTVSRLDEQIIVLQEICNIAVEEKVDAVVIAGDLYDTFNPPIDAIELFYSTLKQLSQQAKIPVIAIAGNHDSPDRIEAPNPLARDNGVLLFGYPKSKYNIGESILPFSISKTDEGFVELTLKNKEKLRVITTPFANEHRMKEAFIVDENKTIVEALQEFWAELALKYCDNSGVNIIVGHHLMLANATDVVEEPDDEKPIESISALLPTSIVPEQIQYVALGHLHRFQTIKEQPRIIYSGSPCAYSFSEAMQKKYVAIVSADAGKEVSVKQVQLNTAKTLIRKKCKSIADAQLWLQENQNCFVELTITTDTFFTPAEVKSLHELHSGIIYVVPDILLRENDNVVDEFNDHERPITEVFEDYFESKHGQKPNDEIRKLFAEIISS